MEQRLISYKKCSRKVAMLPGTIVSCSSRYHVDCPDCVQVIRDPLGKLFHLVNHNTNGPVYVTLSI